MGPEREGWLSEPSKLILLPQHLEPRTADYVADLGVWRVACLISTTALTVPNPAQHLPMSSEWKMPVFEEAT